MQSGQESQLLSLKPRRQAAGDQQPAVARDALLSGRRKTSSMAPATTRKLQELADPKSVEAEESDAVRGDRGRVLGCCGYGLGDFPATEFSGEGHR